MKKTEVYSWRISPDLKSALEDAARHEGISVARLLERIVTAWLQYPITDGDEADAQRRLHAAAEQTIGTIHGGDPQRATQAAERIQAKLRRRHASSRLD